MSTTVTYKGSTLTTVNNQTRTLETAGKYLEDDITLVDVSGGGSPTLQNKTVYPSSSDQSITADVGYDGLGTVTAKAVTTTNLTAANIVSGVTVEVGDADDSDRILSVTGTASGGGGAVSGTFSPAENLRSITLSDCIGKDNILIYPSAPIVVISGARTHWGSCHVGATGVCRGSTNSTGASWSLTTGSGSTTWDKTTGTMTITAGANSNYGGYYASGMTYSYQAW